MAREATTRAETVVATGVLLTNTNPDISTTDDVVDEGRHSTHERTVAVDVRSAGSIGTDDAVYRSVNGTTTDWPSTNAYDERPIRPISTAFGTHTTGSAGVSNVSWVPYATTTT